MLTSIHRLVPELLRVTEAIKTSIFHLSISLYDRFRDQQSALAALIFDGFR
jgi:hypothetical protein